MAKGPTTRHADSKPMKPQLGPLRKSSGGVPTMLSLSNASLSTPMTTFLTDEISDTTSSVHSFASDSSSSGTNNQISPSTLSSSLFTKRSYEPIFRNIANLDDHFKYVHEKLDSMAIPTASVNYHNDYAYISPDSVPGYTLISQLVIHESLECMLLYHAIHNLTGDKVILRLSSNILVVNNNEANSDNHVAQNSNVASIAGFLNEWYLLSRSNEPKYKRVWCHNYAKSEYLVNPEDDPDYEKNSSEFHASGIPITLPSSLPGVLFPSHSADAQFNIQPTNKSFGGMSRSSSICSTDASVGLNTSPSEPMSEGGTIEDQDSYTSTHEPRIKHKQQKRFMMVYPDNEYVTIKSYNYESVMLNVEDKTTTSSANALSLNLGLILLQVLLAHSQQLNPFLSTNAWLFNDDKLHLSGRSLSIPSLPENGTTSYTDNISSHSLEKAPPVLSPYVIIEMLNDFISICQTLKAIHELGIVHNGITSHSILKSTIDPSDIKLTTWDFSFTYQPESTKNGFRIKHLKEFPDLVAYMSPETYGKLASDLVDYKSDLYSLGIVMYEKLLGKLPFYDDNAFEIVRLQMLRKPVAPKTLAPNWFPSKLNFIILKLLEKVPEKRYLSAASLMSDLHVVRNQLIDTVNLSAISNFTLRDRFRKQPIFETELLSISPIISPSSRFSANDTFKEMRDTYEKCLDDVSKPHVFLLDGESGTGKSYLVSHLKPLTLERNLLICDWSFGKEHDVLVISTYTSFVHGLRQIISQIMGQPMEAKRRWKKLILDNLPLDGGVLFYMFPDLKEFLGPQYSNLYNGMEDDEQSQGPHQQQPMSDQGEQSASDSESQWNDVKNNGLSNKESKLRYAIKSLYLLFVINGLSIFLDDFHYCTRDQWSFIYECFDYFQQNTDEFKLCMFVVFNKKERPPSSLDVISMDELRGATKALEADVHEFHIGLRTKEELRTYLEDVGAMVPETEKGLMWKSSWAKIEKSNQSILENVYKITKGNYLDARTLIRGIILMNKVEVCPIQYLNSWNNQTNYKFSPKTLNFATQGTSDLRLSSLTTVYFDFNFDEEVVASFSQDSSEAFIELSIPKDNYQTYIDVLNFACIICENSIFSLNDLSIACNLSIGEVFKIMNVLIERRIIMSNSIYYKIPFHRISEDENFPFDLSDSEVWQLTKYATYSFAYPALRSYFYSNLESTNQLAKYHRLAGLRFFKTWKHDPSLPILNYFAMAHHFYKSWTAVECLKEKEIYYKVFLKAGKHAMSIYSLKMSLRYYELAGKFVTTIDPKNMLSVNLAICQNMFYLGQFEDALKLIDHVALTYNIDKSLAVITRIRCHFKLNNSTEAISIAVHELKRLGLEVSTDPEECKEIYSRHMKKLILSVNEIRKLMTLKRTKRSSVIMAYEIISEIIAPSYALGKNDLRKSIVIQIISLMTSRGLSPHCAIPLIDLANTMAKENTSSGFVQAKEFAQVALSFLLDSKNLPYSFVQSVYEAYITTLAVYVDPLPNLTNVLELSMITPSPFVNSGSYGMEFMMSFSKMEYRFLGGTSAVSFLTNYAKSLGMSSNFISDMINSCLKLFNGEMTFELFSDIFGQLDEKPTDYQLVFYMVTLLYFHDTGKFEQAVTMVLDFFYDLLDLFLNTTIHVHGYFLIALVIQGSRIDNPETYSGARKDIFEDIYQRFCIWHEVCPLNFKSKHLTLTALRGSKETPTLETLDKFEEAIDASLLTGNWYDSAMANAWCARWLVTEVPKSKRISRYLQVAIAMFETADYHTFSKSLTTQFRDYLSDDKYTWAGVANNEPLSSTGTGTGTGTVAVSPSQLTAINNITYNDHSNTKKQHDIILSAKIPAAKESKSDVPTSKRGVHWADKEYEITESMWEKAVEARLSLSESEDISEIVVKLLKSTISFAGVEYGVVALNENDENIIAAIGTSNSVHGLREPLHGRHDLAPHTVLEYTLQSGKAFNLDKDYMTFKNRFALDLYYATNKCSSMCCIPLVNQTGVCGAIYLECQLENKPRYPFFGSRKMNMLKLLATQAAVSLLKVSLYAQMEIAKRAAEDATSEKASFLANMSHEIRTPFNSLLSCSIFLLDTNLTRTQKEYVETIRDSAMVTLNIIDGILSLSKMEHGSFALETSPFLVNECIESAVQFVSEQANSKNLELVFYNKCPEIEFINGDVTRFRQILINLVGNSVKFTEYGHIIVEVAAEPLIHDRYQLTISVKDTGIGIPEEARNKVFGAFSQVDGSSRRVYGGSGLGLAISKRIAELMGGELSFESESGVGSSFYFILNVEAKLRQAPEFTPQQVLTIGKVLICDTHEFIREDLRITLKNWGIEASVVGNLNEIRENLDEFSIAFIDSGSYDTLKKHDNLIKGIKYMTAPFGDMATANDNFVDEQVILTFPYHDAKVLGLLKDYLKSKELSSIVTNGLSLVQGMTILQLPTPTDDDSVQFTLSTGDSLKDVLPPPEVEAPIILKLGERYPLRILLAEDNFINTKVATQHLKKFGYQVDHAKDGVDALEKLYALLEKEQKYDIIFMDIQMPRMDGIAATIELQRELKARHLEAYLPHVVALTANVAGEDRERSLECGMVDFISKPILPSELERVLTKIGKTVYSE
ncbi:uncharacterized protein KQ657_000204 [Scheffersomyces spartinae]|uniref:histidine kinase n=1 Tax=Scheffersomyces spartinae TaxID=45513 RepID=A0A9P7VE85_9ASCO|nr:uncharacterized protein KQ657_000204 [Scheffersomyces spartinae]KAG7196192.1 hypothetical protein KQ657_000204 [Scheffersomyces spartinae]